MENTFKSPKINYKILEENSINKAMLNGLKDALASDLKDSLMQTAEKEVDKVIENIVSRFEIYLQKKNDPFLFGDKIQLDFLLRKEKDGIRDIK
jgi:uncharacterized phage infection (PIP) family protein YhgE